MSKAFHRVLIILTGALFTLVALYFASTTLPFKITELLKPTNNTRIEFEKYNKSFNDEYDFHILVKKASPFNENEIIKVLESLHQKFDHDLRIKNFQSLYNGEFLKIDGDFVRLTPFLTHKHQLTKELKHELNKDFLRNSYASSDFSSLLVTGSFNTTKTISQERKNIKELLSTASKVENEFNDIQIHLIGTKVAQYFYYLETIRNQNFLTPVLLICLGALIFYLFRSMKVLGIFLFIILLSYASVIYLIALNEGGISSYSGFAMFFILVVATSDLVHFFSVYLTHTNSSIEQSLKRVREEVFMPCLFTSLTTAVCFISLIPNSIVPISNIGIYASFGSIICFLLTFYLLPILVKVFNITPVRKFYMPVFKVRSLVKFVLNGPKKAILFFFILTAFFIFKSTGLIINDDFYTKFSQEHPLSLAVKDFREKFNSIGSLDLAYMPKQSTTSQEVLQKMLEFEKHVAQLPEVSHIKSFAGMYQYTKDSFSHLPQTDYTEKRITSLTDMMMNHGAFSNFYNQDSQLFRGIVFLKTTSSKDTQTVLLKINKLAKDYQYFFSVKPRGFVTLRTLVFDKLTKNFLLSFLFSLLSIFILFLLIFKSLSWALIGLLPNIIPLLLIGGLLSLLNMPMDSNLVLMVCITLGIAVDDTIHFLWALKHQLNEQTRTQLPELKNAILKAFDKTSKALLGTTLIFTLSFPCFFLADLKIFYQVGTFVILSLIFALAADFLLLPALLLTISKNKAPRP